jgi:hypothetical protein
LAEPILNLHLQGVLFEVTQNQLEPAAAIIARRKRIEHAWRQRAALVVIHVHRQADLLEMALALGSLGRFPDLLNGRQEYGHENSNDGDDDQQLNECEGRGEARAFQHGRDLSLKSECE